MVGRSFSLSPIVQTCLSSINLLILSWFKLIHNVYFYISNSALVLPTNRRLDFPLFFLWCFFKCKSFCKFEGPSVAALSKVKVQNWLAGNMTTLSFQLAVQESRLSSSKFKPFNLVQNSKLATIFSFIWTPHAPNPPSLLHQASLPLSNALVWNSNHHHLSLKLSPLFSLHLYKYTTLRIIHNPFSYLLRGLPTSQR